VILLRGILPVCVYTQAGLPLSSPAHPNGGPPDSARNLPLAQPRPATRGLLLMPPHLSAALDLAQAGWNPSLNSRQRPAYALLRIRLPTV
jgi:hypothetical protein